MTPSQEALLGVINVERQFFDALNAFVEPAARAGFLSPERWPVGVVVLETVGRRSGRVRSTPVMAMLIDGHAIVGTVRGERSDWFRNLEASGRVRYWLGGEAHDAQALSFAPGREPPPVEDLPPLVQDAVCGMLPAVDTVGCRFAVLVPSSSKIT